MGIWDVVSGTTDSLKRNAPDLTAVTNWCPDVTAAKNVRSSAYGYGSAAVTKVDGAVRGNLIHYYQNQEAWSKIVKFSTIVAKNATHECFKLVPGGSAAYNIGTGSIRDFNNSNKQEVNVKELQANLLRLEKEFSEYKELNKPCADLKSPCTTNIHSVARQKLQDMEFAYSSNIHSVGTRKPEDVIRVFMMKEFMFRQFCDDLIVPVALCQIRVWIRWRTDFGSSEALWLCLALSV